MSNKGLSVPEIVVSLGVLRLGLCLPEDDRVGDGAEGERLVLGHVGGGGVDAVDANAKVVLQRGDVHGAQELSPLPVYEPAALFMMMSCLKFQLIVILRYRFWL